MSIYYVNVGLTQHLRGKVMQSISKGMEFLISGDLMGNTFCTADALQMGSQLQIS
ncbi:MAG: hypothetical protein IPO92_12115 [Saprospiraceae bacterium]|nr:hypothetical protein [Saprospiraceae bacterium]